MTEQIPAGYMMNPQGYLVPVSKVSDLDKLRDDLVLNIIGSARGLQDEMKAFKTSIMGDIGAFIQLSAEQYQTTIGGRKGNLTLTTFNGQYKLILAISDTLYFDERLLIAKQLIDECIHEWTKDSDDNIKTLIEHAFQTDKAGNINTARVLSLLKLKIEHPTWIKAMEAIKDSISVASSKNYIRLYEKAGEDGKFKQISLDIASL